MTKSAQLIKLIEFVAKGVQGIGPVFPSRIEDDTKGMKLSRSDKQKVNEYLYEISKEYHKTLPIGDVLETLECRFGIVALQEDNTPWSGLLLGDVGNVTLSIAWITTAPIGIRDTVYDTIYNNAKLVFQWHKMSETRNYEINAYIS